MKSSLRYTILCLFILITSQVVSAQSSDEAQVLAIVNQERATAGLSALAWDSCLGTAARVHNQDMIANGFFDHISASNGSTPSQRAANAGNPSTAIGENIAAGQTSPSSVMSAWMSSSGHRANILRTSYTHIGISRVNNHWTQVFGNAGCSGGSSTTSTTSTTTSTPSSTSNNSGSQSYTDTTAQVDPGLCGATVFLSGATNGIACRVLNAGGVGNQAVIDMGLVNAVDISGTVSGQLTVCLQGTGSMIFLDSAGIPRTPVPIASYTGSNGTTCATLTTTGTLALVGGQATTPSTTINTTTPTSSVTVTTTTTTVTTNTTQTTVTDETFTHVVQAGENLFRIGLRYNVHFTELARINGIDSSYRIYVGQVLVIPVR
ncbi:MAG: hypothetical protein Phog2KO_19890 [Phototrophicaceae bacterium]